MVDEGGAPLDWRAASYSNTRKRDGATRQVPATHQVRATRRVAFVRGLSSARRTARKSRVSAKHP